MNLLNIFIGLPVAIICINKGYKINETWGLITTSISIFLIFILGFIDGNFGEKINFEKRLKGRKKER